MEPRTVKDSLVSFNADEFKEDNLDAQARGLLYIIKGLDVESQHAEHRISVNDLQGVLTIVLSFDNGNYLCAHPRRGFYYGPNPYDLASYCVLSADKEDIRKALLDRLEQEARRLVSDKYRKLRGS